MNLFLSLLFTLFVESRSLPLHEIQLPNGFLLKIICPASIGWETQKSAQRSCSVYKRGNKWDLMIESQPTLDDKDFRLLKGAMKIEIEWLPTISSVSQLAKFMAGLKRGSSPRFNQVGVTDALKKVGEEVAIGSTFDLSKGNFDPREPDNPDIFVLLKGDAGALWLKDAGHLKFDWPKLQLIRKI